MTFIFSSLQGVHTSHWGHLAETHTLSQDVCRVCKEFWPRHGAAETVDWALASVQSHHSGDTGMHCNANMLIKLQREMTEVLHAQHSNMVQQTINLSGHFWTESRGLWLSDAAASHVGTSAEGPSIRDAAERLSEEASSGRPRPARCRKSVTARSFIPVLQLQLE